ncbi:hypothetical protein OG705_29570 [Streptomyces sp. NBC_00838]|uniref:hypothetical protein n=1 Tax=Streptomyces sp. NBC_00838 TaxID=2903680 RepID=UPI00386A01EE|nr:hypothetical protein OG705_29570 [Streptomyces sp. NBC_00838]
MHIGPATHDRHDTPATPPTTSETEANRIDARFEPSPHGRRQATAALSALLLIACSASLIRACAAGGRIYGLALDPATVDLADTAAQWLVNVAHAVWLFRLVGDRVRGATSRTQGRWHPVAALVTGVVVILTGVRVAGLSPLLEEMITAGALVWLTLEVCLRHGVTPARLGIWPLWPPKDRRAENDNAASALLATVGVCYISAEILVGLLSTIMGPEGFGLPLLEVSQRTAAGLSTPLDVIVRTLTSVVTEDLVVVAATTALMTAARRPTWQIYTVIGAIEVLLHAYMGAPAVAYLVYALVRCALYRTYGLVVPLMAGHLIYNLGDLTF